MSQILQSYPGDRKIHTLAGICIKTSVRRAPLSNQQRIISYEYAVYYTRRRIRPELLVSLDTGRLGSPG